MIMFLNVSNYFILASTWDSYKNFLSLSLMNIFIGLFLLGNIVVTLSLFIGRKNNMMDKIKFLGISSKNPIFKVLYSILGTGCVLWTLMFQESASYFAMLINHTDIKRFKRLI